jgi:serine/threonine protein kinase
MDYDSTRTVDKPHLREATEREQHGREATPPRSRTREEFKNYFRLEQIVGKGGSGVVYSGFIRATATPVAIKFLKDSSDPESRLRFLQEAHLLSTIQHPNLVHVFEFGDVGGALYQIVEFMNGGTLRTALRQEGAFHPTRVVRLGMDLLEGLGACHAKGIVHRDIKPENIFLVGTQACKLGDLGVARTVSRPGLTPIGEILGTPAYMSPEQAGDRPVVAASDLYAAGVVLYEMLCGEPPFPDSSDPFQLLKMHLEIEPVPIERRVPGLSAGLAHAIAQALAKPVQDRPATASAFALGLAACPEARG